VAPSGVRDGGTNEIPIDLQEMLKTGLSLLWRAFEYARDLHTESREFAVERDALYQTGWSAVDLRWLIARGYLQVSPKAAPASTPRDFAGDGPPWENNNSSFSLTETGAALALQVLSRTPGPDAPAPAKDGKAGDLGELSHIHAGRPRPGGPTPSWDSDRKQLRFEGCVIKQFKWAAANQETVLTAFEEEHWPTRIDDPLPLILNQDPKARLHDTIKCLNRNHRRRLIRFSGDGTGEGVVWAVLRPTIM
jgi:hypothetical protein